MSDHYYISLGEEIFMNHQRICPPTKMLLRISSGQSASAARAFASRSLVCWVGLVHTALYLAHFFFKLLRGHRVSKTEEYTQFTRVDRVQYTIAHSLD